MWLNNNEDGSALWMVLGVAIVCAIAAYGALFAAIGSARRAEFHIERTQARYAAEGALVWAMDQLWSDPAWPNNGAGGTVTVPVGGINASVTLPACAQTPCETRQIQITVSN